MSGISIPLTLGPGSAGTLSGGTAATDSAGTATYSSLQVNAPGNGDTLVASLPLTASGITPSAAANATSNPFAVFIPGTPAAQPLITPPTGTYTSAQSVNITDTTPGATIYYTTDGTNPSRSSAVFSGTPIPVSASQTIKALAFAPNYGTSPEGAVAYTIIPPYAASPTFNNVAPGTSPRRPSPYPTPHPEPGSTTPRTAARRPRPRSSIPALSPSARRPS